MKRSTLIPFYILVASIFVGLIGCSREQESEPAATHPAAIDDNHTYDGVRIQGAVAGEWTHDWDAALSSARALRQPYLALFTASDWNNWHAYFAKRVLDTPEWKAWIEKYPLILAWINFPNDETLLPKGIRDRNRTLVRQYGASDFPALLVMNSATRQSHGRYRVTSDTSAAEFIAWVQRIIMDNQPGGIKNFLTADDITVLEMLRQERAPLRKQYEDALDADNKELDALRARKATSEEISAWAKKSDERLADLKAPVTAFTQQIGVYYARAFEVYMRGADSAEK